MKSRWAVCLICSCLFGCQSYQRKPLDMADELSKWSEQSLESEELQTFAAALAESQGLTPPKDFNLVNGITLREAEALALFANPALMVARARAQVPLESAKEAGWWPDPEMQVEVLRFLNRGKKTRFRFDRPSFDGVNAGILSGSGAGVESTPLGVRRRTGDYIEDAWIAGGSLTFTIPISGRLAVEQDVRWSEYSAAWRHILVAEWKLLTDLRSAWYRWTTHRRRLDTVREYIIRLESLSKIAADLTEAGELPLSESRVLAIELAQERSELMEMMDKEYEARLHVVAMLGLHGDEHTPLVQEVSVEDIAIDEDKWMSILIEKHPEIKAAEAEYEVTENALRLEIRHQYPDLSVGPAYSFDEGISRLGLGFGFPLPIWNRNRESIARALAERDLSRTQAQFAIQRVFFELLQAEHHLKHATEHEAYLVSEVIPLVDQQITDTASLLEMGEVNILLLRDALADSLETRLDLLDVSFERALAANEIKQMLSPRWVTVSESEKETE